MGFQFGGDLVGQGQRGFSLPRPGERVDGGPDAGFQPERRAAFHGQAHGLPDQRVLILARLGPGEPEERLEQLPAAGGARLASGQLVERRPGHAAGGGPVAEVFQAADQRDLHRGEPAAVAEVAADPVRGLPGHHALHQPGVRVFGHLDGLRQHRGRQPAPFARGQRSGLLGQARGGRVSQPDQRPGPYDVLISGLPDGVQDGQRPVSLPDRQDATCPRQRRRLARGRRPVQAGVDHRIHRR